MSKKQQIICGAIFAAVIISFNFFWAADDKTPAVGSGQVAGTGPAIGSGSTGASGFLIQWERISDPIENAFTVEVPKSWLTSAGTWRRSAVEVGHVVMTTSPDSNISLVLGERGARMFTVPNAATAMLGGEGKEYIAGPNLTTIIRNYHTGAQAAADLLWLPIGPVCGFAKPVQVRDLPQQSAILNYAFGHDGPIVTMSAGDASFSCNFGGKAGAAYVFATTQKVDFGGTALWNVPVLAEFIATEDQAGNAMELLNHLVGSVKMNPDWIRKQGQTTMRANTIVTNTNSAISTSIGDSFWYRRALQDQTFARGSQARRGVMEYYDPVLRENHESSNQGYKWINPAGLVVTTTTYDPPGPGFRELKPVAPKVQ